MIDIETLINKDHPLDDSYKPAHLRITDFNKHNFHNFVDPTLKPSIDERIYVYYKALQEAALKDGLILIVDSGYRSYQYQKKVYEAVKQEKGETYANQFVAPPGCSEHQSGLAIDFAYIRNHTYFDNLKETDPEAIWLMHNAYRFGFILRYPKYKENETGFSFEPWHYRFVGTNLAKYLFENNLTLEAYYLNKDKKK